ncbi:MAG TPA: competence/damage-inducible protein A [Dissulfurispiraceae bacterium]|nr:competence/damage-inducible protein A [Dissulfurispiraceae bacterium]
MKRKTAGIVVIGDEILSGKVQDGNSFFMARELRARGVEVRRIVVIPDETEEIARTVRSFAEKFDLVFTSGGIGPTHDDVTIAGISAGFGVRPVIDEQLSLMLLRMYKELTPERLRMAEVPEGAELVSDGSPNLPAIRYRNVYILPGIPELLVKKFIAIVKSFGDAPLILKKVYLNDEYESEIARTLNEIVKTHKDVKIGSYPVMGGKDYSVMVTFESLDEAHLDSAVSSLVRSLPPEKVVRVEG